MKKLASLCVAALILSLMCSCEKDNLGYYQPKMKIEKIYTETDGHYLREHWKWNGDFLNKINFYRKNGDVEYTQSYIYDGKRLSRIETDNQYTEFLYDGKVLTTINTYYQNQQVESYELSYDQKKLSHISIVKSGHKAYHSPFSVLNYFVPAQEEVVDVCLDDQDVKRENYNYSKAEVDFVWDGDNVKYMKMKINRPDSMQRLTFTYTYDESLNPMIGFFNLQLDHVMLNDQPMTLLFSKNNAISIYVTDEYDVYSKTTSFTYGFECYKKYPTKVYKTKISTTAEGIDSTLIYSYRYLN